MSSGTWTLSRSMLFTGVALAAAILVDQIVGCMSAPAQLLTSQQIGISTDEPPATADDLIMRMASSAGVIFVGEVIAVRQPLAGFAGSPEAASEGVVGIDFRIDQVVRGVATNSVYTLREWGGLWAGGAGRYRIGQRYLMMLRSPDGSGFSSPAHGAEGAIPLRGGGIAPGPDDLSTGETAEWMADIRWIQAQVLRSSTSLGMPWRGPLPIRGGRGPISESSSFKQPFTPSAEHPFLVNALSGPWIEQESVPVPAESLSHVLELCAKSIERRNASK